MDKELKKLIDEYMPKRYYGHEARKYARVIAKLYAEQQLKVRDPEVGIYKGGVGVIKTNGKRLPPNIFLNDEAGQYNFNNKVESTDVADACAYVAQSLLTEFERRYEIYWDLSLKVEETRFCHHTRMKNTYKAMATRDCIKELKKTFKL